MSSSRTYSDARVMRLGAITLVVMALIMAAAFNLGKFPGFAGTSYRAEFKDASGLHVGNMVQVGGIRVGRVQDVELEDSNTVVVRSLKTPTMSYADWVRSSGSPGG